MSALRVGNAPCSWGTLEFVGLPGQRIGYRQMLDELRATGYAGTELGDWGFLPTEPAALREALDRRGLGLIGAYLPVRLKDPAEHQPGLARALRAARLLAAGHDPTRDGQPPWLVLADDNGAEPSRVWAAGRVGPELGLDAAGWRTFVGGAERIARAVRDETGLGTAFHPHCAGYVETPDEIARFVELTDPALIGLTFDTGHYAYGSGTGDGRAVLDGLARFGERVRHVHFKDCDARLASRARAAGWGYFETVRRGLFCELGRGCVDFPAVLALLGERGYRGWIVVEQDVLPGLGTPRESAARNRAYLAALGLERTGPERTGPERTGLERTGPGTT